MNLKPLAALFLVATLADVPAPAQIKSPPTTASASGNMQPEEKQVLEKMALASLDDLVNEGMGLRLPENRIPVLIFAADMLWKRDEKRARGYLQEAISQYLSMGPPPADRGSRSISTLRTRLALRNRLIITIAQFYPRMAMDFMRSSRLPESATPDGGLPGVEDEKQLEMRLAAQIAEADPQLALQLAQEALKQEPDYQLVEIWRRLQRKDPKAASGLAGEIVARLKTTDLMKNYGAASIIYELVEDLRRMVRDQKAPKRETGQSAETAVSIQEVEQNLRSFLELVVATTLKVTPANLMDVADQGPARSLLTQAQSLQPEIEKYLPSRAGALRTKLNQFDNAYYHPPSIGENYEELEKRSTTELMAMAEKSKGEAKEMLYSQALMKALAEEQVDLAKQISKQHLNGSQDFLSSEIERVEREKAVKEGKIDEARKTLEEIPSETERALSLVRMAGTAKDPQICRQLLEEARATLGDKFETRGQVESQMILATAFLPYDAEYSFAQLNAAIEKLNTVIAASITLMKFTQELRTEEDDSRLTQAGMPEWFSGGIDQQILAFAQKDFARTQTAIGQWQHDQLRLGVRMMLIATILSGDNADLRQRYQLQVSN
ncbi:MAG TPA: hypothetical protein VJ302_30070 [Blastocatellia bacterium]|nr:hypothetical protein [Blastocatellia bacterium]